jgi:para-nitrobenzyl esterase
LGDLQVLRRACALAVVAVAVVPAAAQAAASRVVVDTPQGAVSGVRAKGADRFLGLPYAKPPLKARRFKPPVPASDWNGTRDATRQAPACTQFQPTGVRDSQPTAEDCLYLDVYRPSTARRGDKLPVLVWLHGGGNTQGTGVIYGGQTMASLTNTVVVSINYRLGAFGWLSLPQLDAETPAGSGNWGQMDQLESLKWVRRNIAAYGGDGKLVTIAGQSAGASGVCGLLAAPSAKGYFQRAIIESGPCRSTPTAATTQKTGLNFAHAAGCTDDSIVVACLRATWVGNLVAAEQKFVVSGRTTGTSFMPQNPRAAIANGTWNRVPVLIGNVRNESRLLNVAAYKTTPQQYTDTIRFTYGAAADDVLARYPLASYPAPFYALTSVQTDTGNACQSQIAADALGGATPTYEYEFNDPTSPTLYGFQPPGIDMSNGHSAELAYLFDFTLGDRPLTATQRRLATQMKRYWASFARTGDPNVRGEPRWPRHTAENDQILTLGAGGKSSATTGFAAEHQCDFWAAHGVTYAGY